MVTDFRTRAAGISTPSSSYVQLFMLYSSSDGSSIWTGHWQVGLCCGCSFLAWRGLRDGSLSQRAACKIMERWTELVYSQKRF